MNFTPNPEQIKSLVRAFVGMFGAGIAGWFAAKGWFTVDQVLSVLNGPVFGGAVLWIITAIWGLMTHTQSNAVAVADRATDVAGVVMKNTETGAAIAKDNPSQTVAVAGTQAAAQVATK